MSELQSKTHSNAINNLTKFCFAFDDRMVAYGIDHASIASLWARKVPRDVRVSCLHKRLAFIDVNSKTLMDLLAQFRLNVSVFNQAPIPLSLNMLKRSYEEYAYTPSTSRGLSHHCQFFGQCSC